MKQQKRFHFIKGSNNMGTVELARMSSNYECRCASQRTLVGADRYFPRLTSANREETSVSGLMANAHSASSGLSEEW